MFEQYKVYRYELAGRPLVIETGKMAQLSNGSCLVRYGDTAVLANATASAAPREGIDFLPLSVDYEEKLYAAGKIPGSWNRREGRPSDKAIITSRMIDRPIRPLFPKDLRNDIVISVMVMSVDPDCSPEIAGLIGASTALSISDIPWNGPIGGLFVGLVDGEIVINPNAEQREKSELELTVAATKEKVVMIEAGAKEVPEDIMFNAIMKAHEEIKPLIDFISSIQAEIGKPKFEYPSCDIDPVMYEKIADMVAEEIKEALFTDDKRIRDERLKPIYDKVYEALAEEYPDQKPMMNECLYKLQKQIVRRWLLDEQKRVDGRRMDEIRPLAAEVGLLPRVHGSGMFTRGQTQVVTTCTLAPLREAQMLDGIDDEDTKRYMHHYNMPGYSTGEAKAARSPGRREIGHGALAERALEPVLPSVEEFPYAIRCVSEVISSNGSTSQASVCGSTLALMDAGVPIKAPVAGISCGLITEGDRWMTIMDIQGLEDFFGDMDFKVAGTKNGITAIQMDLKIDGLTPEIIKAAFETTREGRLFILDTVMLPCISAPRPDVSKYAPKMISTKIDVDKIRDVIGSGGKVIQKICSDTGAKIDIEDDGSVFIAAIDKEAGYKALQMIEAIVKDPEPGTVFVGKVTRIMNFGAFVEIAPGKEGLVHISQLDKKRVAKVEDVVSVGDEIKVLVTEIDDKGRINLSRKDALNLVDDKK
ncbi:MAG TPA: polyribonucleotide nucleotidyltransferase [Bacillota bacterium]|nr:polyribonucleotide nucleotidyltransferase [Bacillota bacterium]HOK68022.1 polyribonucleotide nucleotidyltransferase [Bacillota bacterium]HPP84568.1 polyribonucleotide nucleotidyltransferase [Bacillota bacterium]